MATSVAELQQAFIDSRGYTPWEWFQTDVIDTGNWAIVGLTAEDEEASEPYEGPVLYTEIQSGIPFSTDEVPLGTPLDEGGAVTSSPIIQGPPTVVAIDGQGNETPVINNVNLEYTIGGSGVAFDGAVTSEVIQAYTIQAVDSNGVTTTYDSIEDVPEGSTIFYTLAPLDGVVVLRYDFDITYSIEGEGDGHEGVSSLFLVVQINYTTFAEALIQSLCSSSSEYTGP